jgi:hypothetical protein
MRCAHMIIIASAILVGLPGSSASADNTKPKAPTAKEAIRTLLDNGQMSLTKIESCKSMVVGQDGTLRDYFSAMLSFQSEAGTSGTFEVTSKQLRASGKVVWQTDVLLRGRDAAGEVWSNGFRFNVNDRSRRLIRSTVSCIGTG